MIRVNLSMLVVIFLVMMLGPVFLLWITNEYRRQRRERAAFRFVVRCTLCGHEFEDRTTELLPRCPRCASLNERFRVSRL